MTIATCFIKFALISAIVVSIDGQFLTRVVGVDDIISLLDNVTDTSKTMSVIAHSLNQSADTQTHIEDTLDRVATTLTRMATTQTEMATTQTQTADALTQILTTQTGMATTQTQMATTQTQTANALAQIVTTQTQMATTQTQMAATLTQMAATQTRMADSLTQLVDLMQIPRDCTDLLSRGSHQSGVYTIRPEDDFDNIHVYCDKATANGGWTVFQKRFDGSVDFFLGWDDYENGFGNPDGEHWIGLRNLHRLTRHGLWTLRVDLEDFDGNSVYAEYDNFSIGDAASFYRLSIGAYSGTAGDSLASHNNKMFSTKDSDHDSAGGSCAQSYRGAWWYKSCYDSNLNGLYLGESQDSPTGMMWWHWKRSEVLKRSEMKIRRVG